MTSRKAPQPPFNQDTKKPHWESFLQFLLQLLVIFLCVGQSVPGINESHYLPKAKHSWDPSFAPGDLFLESHDSHWLASATAGIAALWMPLAAVAWVGRIVSWSLLSVAWISVCRNLRIAAWVAPCALATWLLGVRFGHWAGEWVVGGFEAKAIAYPCVIFALAALFSPASAGVPVAAASEPTRWEPRWSRAWLWLGAAVAWHPLVGGWAGLSVGCLWLGHALRGGTFRRQLLSQLPWLAGGAAIGLVGVLPAAAGLGGPDVIGKISAAQVHVFLRLPHHMAPQLFAAERHYAALVTLCVLVIATIATCAKPKLTAQRSTGDRLEWLLAIAWMAVLFAGLGWLIDCTLSQRRPDVAAQLLRFYWFRWADVAVPLVASLVLWKLLQGRQARSVAVADGNSGRISGRELLRVLAIPAVVVWLGYAWWSDRDSRVPPADRLVVDSVGPNPIRADRPEADRYIDWVAVCRWIRDNTPTDSYWFTPKYQQTFKWYAQRAEVYCWKDVPQDNAAVVEWYLRVNRCDPPRDSQGQIRDWTTQELLDLSREYGFRYVLIDRTYQQSPPALELLYPTVENGSYIDNRSFAVFRIPEALLQ